MTEETGFISIGDARCNASFDLRPQTGEMRCELDAGHSSMWHRNDTAGVEWSGRALWLLPPSARRPVGQAA